ncbi:DNA mismatch repair protein MutL [Candidatus Woesearchaeota archaeon CG08_land_8_20_14_0_20_43_7]|nr:MAG: DNA mismatch repair protein MutL [Candidatus Woesearchaeota archaeon CG08_land_8_20_14_0_20_43_7]
MDKIHLLDEGLINKIAAGEVIERPASVIKEFIENSIDAGSKKIAIDLREGGVSYIKISDDGEGMTPKDAKLCFERHATSKIKDTDDLFSIKTLGFRGEALASVAAVAKMMIQTRQEDETEGTRVIIEGGKLIGSEPIGCPKGTTIEVENLFYNTPARKKYLKSFSTELASIMDIVTRYAIINPQIHFSVNHNGKKTFSSPSCDMHSNLVNIFGLDTAGQMIIVEHSEDGISIKGYISRPPATRSDRSNQSIFINKRYVKNKVITDAVYDAYHTLLTVNRHPFVVLDIKIDPEKIDVNVHPTKIHIRVQSEDRLRKAVFDAIRNSLINSGLIVDLQESSFQDSAFPSIRQAKLDGSLSGRGSTSEYRPTSHRKYPVMTGSQTMLEGSEPLIAREKPIEPTKLDLPRFNVLGQVHRTYIIAEVEEGFYIIDQHVAHERILYERFMESVKNGKVRSQELISPARLELSQKDSLILKDNIDVFVNLGFDIEEFGDNSFVIRRSPIIQDKQLQKEDIMDILDDLLKDLSESISIDKKREKMLITMACRAAIKAGKILTEKEVHDLIADLMKTDNPFTCPHGRPVIIKMSLYELEKLFKRVQ